MSLRSWYFIDVNRVFQGVFLGILISKFQNLSLPTVLRYLYAVLDLIKLLNLREKNARGRYFFINIILLNKNTFICLKKKLCVFHNKIFAFYLFILFIY